MLNDFLKEKFNEKIYKVSLDGGFTCPNRDGKVSKGGVKMAVVISLPQN